MRLAPEAVRNALARLARASALCFALLGTVSAAAEPMRTVGDPLVHSQNVLRMIETEGSEATAGELAKFLKNAKGIAKIAENLRHFDKLKPAVSGIVSDRNYNDLVRTILYYQHYENERFPFLYHLFTYKMTANGWALTNFRFESEVSRAFPEELAPGP